MQVSRGMAHARRGVAQNRREAADETDSLPDALMINRRVRARLLLYNPLEQVVSARMGIPISYQCAIAVRILSGIINIEDTQHGQATDIMTQ